METEDILTATIKLGESGLTHSQSEAIANTIVAAVKPLATKADLKAIKDDLEFGIDSLKEQMVTKSDLNSLKEQMMTKADLESAFGSLKIWLLLILLGVHGSTLAIISGMAFTWLNFGHP